MDDEGRARGAAAARRGGARGGAVGRGAKGFEAGARASSVADGLEGPPPAYVS